VSMDGQRSNIVSDSDNELERKVPASTQSSALFHTASPHTTLGSSARQSSRSADSVSGIRFMSARANLMTLAVSGATLVVVLANRERKPAQAVQQPVLAPQTAVARTVVDESTSTVNILPDATQAGAQTGSATSVSSPQADSPEPPSKETASKSAVVGLGSQTV